MPTSLRFLPLLVLLVVPVLGGCSAINRPPSGFGAMFNGKDLSGWQGLVKDPPARAKMSREELAKAQAAANQSMRDHWSVRDGILVFDGGGDNLCSAEQYGDFEMLVDWKIGPKGDSGIYLRGSPQVQIWDNPIGSGGLYNNEKHAHDPLVYADRPIGEWNSFRIRMIGDNVTVWLNGKLVVDRTTLENYWERNKPIYPRGAIELQNHGDKLYFRNIYVKRLDGNPGAGGGGAAGGGGVMAAAESDQSRMNTAWSQRPARGRDPDILTAWR